MFRVVLKAIVLLCLFGATQVLQFGCRRGDNEVDVAKAQHARTVQYLEQTLNVDIPSMANAGSLSRKRQDSIPDYERALMLLKTRPLDSFFQPVPLAASRSTEDAEGKTLVIGLSWLEREFRVNGFYLVTSEGGRIEYPRLISWPQEHMNSEYWMWRHGRLVYVYTEARSDLVERFGEHLDEDGPGLTVIHLPLETAQRVCGAGLIARDGSCLPFHVFHMYDWEPATKEPGV